MSRRIVEEANDAVASNQREIVDEVVAAIAADAVVVVGMAQNPYPAKARKLLNQAGVKHRYLQYGSYTSDWRRRNALKMWTGWPTFPMVFVKGTFVGGYNDLKRLVDSGELKTMLG